MTYRTCAASTNEVPGHLNLENGKTSLSFTSVSKRDIFSTVPAVSPVLEKEGEIG